MILVGELINASRSAMRQAMIEGDGSSLASTARQQVDAGCHYIDVNAGIFHNREAEMLRWLVELVQNSTGAMCCLDSPDPVALEAALEVHEGRALINSISLETKRRESMLPLLRGGDARVVALCMSDLGMPHSAADRVAIADELINLLVREGMELDDIFIDPLVQPISTDNGFGREAMAAVSTIKRNFPGVHVICGASNISFGLPLRRLLNRTFLVMVVAHGLDAAIIDPTDKTLMAALIAAEALAGQDEFCAAYLESYRQGKLTKTK